MDRVAIVVPSARPGGAERAMLALAPRLAARGLAVTLLVLNSSGRPDPSFPPPRTRTIELRARRVAAALPGLARRLRHERPDCVLAAGTHANVVTVAAAGLARCGARVVVYEQSMLSRVGVAAHRRRDHLLPALAARAYPRADAVAAVSEGVAADLRRRVGLAHGRVQAIPNPLDVAAVRARAADEVDHSWLQSGEPPVVVAVGRLEPVKDHATLLRAFARLRSERPCRLLVIGEGRERPRLERLASELGIAHDTSMPGWVSNPYAFMGRCAVLAHPSLREGLPAALVEALALGLPAVAADCESGPREILAGGRFGRLVSPGDADALAAALDDALRQPPPQIPDDALRRYSPETVADRWVELLRGVE